MSTLHVRNVPSEVYEALRERAEGRNSSISAETVRLLKRAIRTDKLRIREIFDSIEKSRPAAQKAVSVAQLISEDRDGR
jgi:plasmid stability protein